jgi:hypothetical protein
MGGAEDDEQRPRFVDGDARHRLDHVLVALPRAEQAEAEDHPAARQPEIGLRSPAVDDRDVRDAMTDDADPIPWSPVAPVDKPGGGHRHDDRRLGPLDEPRQDEVLPVRRARQDGVKGDHDGRHRRLDEVEDVRPVGAAVDPVFVLDGHDLGSRRRHETGGRRVVAALVLPESPADLRAEGVGVARTMDGDDIAISHRASKVSGERRDPAHPGWVGGQVGDAGP